MAKGSSYEREICRQLSRWWTNGNDEDVFWRTAGSGAMAKTRSKSNKKTFGQYGDVQATNPIGQPLIDLYSIEIKRGYSKHTFAEMMDKLDKAKPQMYEKFIEQASIDGGLSKSWTWILVTKRDRRKALISFPFYFLKELTKEGLSTKTTLPCFILQYCSDLSLTSTRIYCTTLDNFLDNVKPEMIKKIAERKL